ncbi:MAG: DUF2975 domain-containing protein [Bacteroidota bacterium]
MLSTLLKVAMIGIILLMLYLLGLGVGRSLNFLPEQYQASWEIPLKMNIPFQMLKVNSLDPDLLAHDIEVKEAELEVMPKGRWLSLFINLIGILYLTIVGGILYYLNRILESLDAPYPFLPKNAIYLQRIALLVLMLSFYKTMMGFMVGLIFVDKFEIGSSLASIQGPSLSIDFTAFFMAGLLWVLSEVFRKGTELQSLEEQTV